MLRQSGSSVIEGTSIRERYLLYRIGITGCIGNSVSSYKPGAEGIQKTSRPPVFSISSRERRYQRHARSEQK